MDNNFTLFCISNGSETEFPENTLTSFKNKLPLNLEIKKSDHSKWCVALETICFSTLFGNVKWPWYPSFITVSLDYIDDRHRHIYRQEGDPRGRVERKSVSFGTDVANYGARDSEFRDALRRGLNRDIFVGEDRQPYDTYANRAKHELMPDIQYFYPDDFFVTLDSLAKYFETIANQNNMVITRTASSIELTPSPYIDQIENWFLINTKLIYDNPPFKITIEHEDQSFLLAKHARKPTYFHNADVKKIEGKLIKMGGDYYKVFLMGYLLKKITLTLINTQPEIFFPKIVKVKCENVKHQIFDGEFSKDLTIFCPSLKPGDKYFYKQFDTKQFIPLSNTTLDHIDLKLLDQENKPIKLVNGYATIVKLHLRKMPSHKKFFNVRISSQKTLLHPANTKNNFKVSMPNTLNFNSQWKVSVTTINHPTVFNTFPPNTKIKVVHTNGKIYSYSLKEKYESIEELVKDMNTLFSSHNLLTASHGMFNNRLVNRFRFTILKDCVFMIPLELSNVLGNTKNSNDSGAAWLVKVKSDPTQILGNSFNIDMENEVDLHFYRPNYVMMYSNIAAPTILGGEFQNILKVFPVQNNDKQKYQIQEFKHFEYLNLSNHEIKDIEIDFRSHSGDKVFFGGKYEIIVNLLFTNYEE